MINVHELAHNPLAFNTLRDYQQWANSDWVYKAGSDEAQQHARSKLEEESAELVKAMAEHQPEEIVSELGDVLWTASANAHNAGISLEDSFRYSLPDGSFEDSPIPVTKIDDMASEFISGQPLEEVAARLKYLSGYLGKVAKQWHNLSPPINADAQPTTFSETWIQLKAGRTKENLVEIVLICSAIGQQECSKSLQDVMEANAQKLMTRKAAGEPLTKLTE